MAIFGGLGRILTLVASLPVANGLGTGWPALVSHHGPALSSRRDVTIVRLNRSSSTIMVIESTLASPASFGITINLKILISSGLMDKSANPVSDAMAPAEARLLVRLVILEDSCNSTSTICALGETDSSAKDSGITRCTGLRLPSNTILTSESLTGAASRCKHERNDS